MVLLLTVVLMCECALILSPRSVVCVGERLRHAIAPGRGLAHQTPLQHCSRSQHLFLQIK